MKSKRFYIITLVVLIILELTIFNINSYRILFEKDIDKTTYHFKEDDQIVINDIDLDVKTIYVEFTQNDISKPVDYSIIYSDASTKQRGLPVKRFLFDNDKSRYTAVYLSKNVQSIGLNFDKENISDVTIILNKHIPIQFNFYRIIILFIIACLVKSYKTDEFWNKEYTGDIKQNTILFSIVAIVCFIVIAANTYDYNNVYGNLYNVKFVDSIEAGSLSLLEEPSEKLLALKNPYDLIERSTIKRGVDYIWDCALYNGKYYVYYGILPALLLYVPYHLITGQYLPINVGVAIFSVLAIVVLSYIIKLFYEKWFNKLPFKIYAIGLASMLFGVGIIWINVAPRFYEAVTIAGLYFTLQGLYLLWSADYKKKYYLTRLFLSTMCLSLAVACRPPFIICSIFVIIWAIKFVKENINDKRRILKTAVIMAIPYIVVGSLLMIYNYARFGSVLEFGAKYQLTVNDMRNLKSRLWCLPQGIICNLFNVPQIIGKFPFIDVNNNLLEFFGYYFIEDMVSGLFFMTPICFALLYMPKLVKKFSINNKVIKFILSVIVIGTLQLILVTMQGGSTGRYLLDFSWCYILASILIIWLVYSKLKSRDAKNIVGNIAVILVCYIVVFNILTIFLKVNGLGMSDFNPNIYLKIEQMIMFWK